MGNDFFIKTLWYYLKYLYYLYLIFDFKTCAEMSQIKIYKRNNIENFKEKYLW